MYELEHQLWNEGITRIMGLDEVGRGCLAGPVVAAGVIMDPRESIEGINDSKQLTANERVRIAELIKEKAMYWTIRECTVAEIDEKNIYWASVAAMEKCILESEKWPDYLLVDGKQFPQIPIPGTCVIKGDTKSASIAAASILAKVYRDELMLQLHEQLPYYGWNSNVGYPTQKHYEGLQQYGVTHYHRRSFKLKTTKEFDGRTKRY